MELQKQADETGLAIYVRHFPPGTRKWNKIEHRMFCHITEHWRSRPSINHEVIVNLIGNTTTAAGLVEAFAGLAAQDSMQVVDVAVIEGQMLVVEVVPEQRGMDAEVAVERKAVTGARVLADADAIQDNRASVLHRVRGCSRTPNNLSTNGR